MFKEAQENLSMEKTGYDKYGRLRGKLIMVGFGSIGQALLRILFQHLEISPEQVRIISADASGRDIARQFGVEFTLHMLTEENYPAVIEPWLSKGDFLLNLSVDVSSLALIELCWRRGSLYLDTCIEPWLGGYTDKSISVSMRSNYALREKALAFARKKRGGPTVEIGQSWRLALKLKRSTSPSEIPRPPTCVSMTMSLSIPGQSRGSWARAFNLQNWGGEVMSVIGPRTAHVMDLAVMQPFTLTNPALLHGCAAGFHSVALTRVF